MDKIARIRAEIERRVKEYDAIIESQPDSNRAERGAWKWAECKSILSFLDTLSEEPDKSLEEEIDLWISENENIHHGDKLMVWLLKDVAHYFAEWQKNQMLKDAVEGEVIVPIYEGDDTWSSEIKIPGRYEPGDRLRIVILPKEEE